MKNIITYSLFIILCFIFPIWGAYSKSVCSVYATYKENAPSNSTSIGIKPIEDVKLINIKLQGFWEPLLFRNYFSSHFNTIDAIISLLFIFLFMNLRIEFESNDGSKFSNKIYLLAKSLIFISFGYGIFKILFFDDFANNFINNHLPYNLVQVKERNLGVFWIFIPGSIAVAVYKMLKHGKALQNQLDKLNEIQ
jgi:hypothetical protein